MCTKAAASSTITMLRSKLPVFVKADAIIPMTNPNNNPSEIRKDYRAYEIYAEKNAEFYDYDDDGTTQEYLNGRCTRTLVSTNVEGNKLTVDINPTVGDFEGFVAEKQTELRINVSAQPKKVTAKVGKKSVKLAPVSSARPSSKRAKTCTSTTNAPT